MNDKGKTVISIQGVKSSYHRRVKKPARRYIEVTMQLDLNDKFPGEHGYAATMRAIDVVGSRVINAVANEFLP